MPIILVFMELWQEGCKFEASLGYRVNSKQKGYIANPFQKERKGGRQRQRERERKTGEQ